MEAPETDLCRFGSAVEGQLVFTEHGTKMVVFREGELPEHGRYQVRPDYVFPVISTLSHGALGLVIPSRDGDGRQTSLFFYIYIVFKFTNFVMFLVYLSPGTKLWGHFFRFYMIRTGDRANIGRETLISSWLPGFSSESPVRLGDDDIRNPPPETGSDPAPFVGISGSLCSAASGFLISKAEWVKCSKTFECPPSA